MTLRSAVSASRAIRATLLAALVVAALALSAQQALASSVLMDCPYDGQHFLGSCDSGELACNALCQSLHGSDAQGSCTTGCCKCFW
jgi:hypothetical protein